MFKWQPVRLSFDRCVTHLNCWRMSRAGITQELIDETRMVPENNTLRDLQNIINEGNSVDFRGPTGETTVTWSLQHVCWSAPWNLARECSCNDNDFIVWRSESYRRARDELFGFKSQLSEPSSWCRDVNKSIRHKPVANDIAFFIVKISGKSYSVGATSIRVTYSAASRGVPDVIQQNYATLFDR